MANVPFSSLYDHIMPYLPGAEPAIINFHIRRALREFYKRTTLWRESFTFETAPDQPTYLLQPTNGMIHSILSVVCEGNPLPVAPEHMRPPATANGSRPTGWFSTHPNLLSLTPKPDAEYTIVLEAVNTITLDNSVTEFLEETYNEYAEAIASGVVGNMMLMPGKPWTQKDSAAIYIGQFIRTVIATRAKLRDGGQPNASTIRGPRYGK